MRRALATFGLMASGIGAGVTSGYLGIGDAGLTRARFGYRAALTTNTAVIPTIAAIGGNSSVCNERRRTLRAPLATPKRDTSPIPSLD